jgi:hypothetical protein
MKQHITYDAGGTLKYVVRDENNDVRYPDSAVSAGYSIFKETDSKYNATAKITGTCTYGWTTSLASAHNATAGQMLKMDSTAGVVAGDLLLITDRVGGFSEQLRIVNVVDGTTGRVRISRQTEFDYSSADIVNPTLKVSISSAQAQSASLLDIDQNHRIQFDYKVNSKELSENQYFDVVRRWPRPPVIPDDIYSARPELRRVIKETYLMKELIDRAWDDILKRVRIYGKLPQYIQNEEVLKEPCRELSLYYVCRDIAQMREDDVWEGLAAGYLSDYQVSVESSLTLLRVDGSEELEPVSASGNIGVYEFRRGGRGGNNLR